MSTALELGREGWRRYLKGVRRSASVSKDTSAEWQEREDLMARTRKAAEAAKTQCGARRVVLFGSLAHEGWLGSDSDVDLAVEGLVGEAYWEVWRLAEEIIGDRRVDLIDMDAAGRSLRQAIERYGVEL